MNKKLKISSFFIACALFASQQVFSGEPMKVNIKQKNEQLSIERIFSSPSLNGQTPKSLTFSPDGSRVTYLQGKCDDLNRYDLWEYNLQSKENKLLVDSQALFSGTEILSNEEKARRERQRIYGFGIMEYKFSNYEY